MARSNYSIAGLLSLNTTGFQKDIIKARQSMNGFARSVNTMKYSLKGIGATFGTGLGISALVRSASEFEHQMARTNAIMGSTADQIQRVDDLAKKMGETTIYSATSAGKAMEYLAMAGFNAEKSMKALPGVLQLATIGNISLGESADIATNVMTGFGLKAEELARVNDVMAKTITSSNTNIIEMGNAFKLAAPVAGQMGENIEQVSVAIALMANAGIKGAEAGTAYAQSMSRLLRSPKDVMKAFDELGISMDEQRLKSIGLVGAMRLLHSSGASTTQMAKLLGRHYKALLPVITASTVEFGDMTAEIYNNVDAAKNLAEEGFGSVKRSLEEVKNSAERMAIALGEGGADTAIKDLADSLNVIIDTTTHLIDTFGTLSLAGGVLGTVFTYKKVLPYINASKIARKQTQDLVSAEKELIAARKKTIIASSAAKKLHNQNAEANAKLTLAKRELAAAEQKVASSTVVSTKRIGGLAGVMNIAKTSARALGASLKALGTSLAGGLAVTAILSGLDMLADKLFNTSDKMDELSTKLEEISKKYGKQKRVLLGYTSVLTSTTATEAQKTKAANDLLKTYGKLIPQYSTVEQVLNNTDAVYTSIITSLAKTKASQTLAVRTNDQYINSVQKVEKALDAAVAERRGIGMGTEDFEAMKADFDRVKLEANKSVEAGLVALKDWKAKWAYAFKKDEGLVKFASMEDILKSYSEGIQEFSRLSRKQADLYKGDAAVDNMRAYERNVEKTFLELQDTYQNDIEHNRKAFDSKLIDAKEYYSQLVKINKTFITDAKKAGIIDITFTSKEGQQLGGTIASALSSAKQDITNFNAELKRYLLDDVLGDLQKQYGVGLLSAKEWADGSADAIRKFLKEAKAEGFYKLIKNVKGLTKAMQEYEGISKDYTEAEALRQIDKSHEKRLNLVLAQKDGIQKTINVVKEELKWHKAVYNTLTDIEQKSKELATIKILSGQLVQLKDNKDLYEKLDRLRAKEVKKLLRYKEKIESIFGAGQQQAISVNARVEAGIITVDQKLVEDIKNAITAQQRSIQLSLDAKLVVPKEAYDNLSLLNNQLKIAKYNAKSYKDQIDSTWSSISAGITPINSLTSAFEDLTEKRKNDTDTAADWINAFTQVMDSTISITSAIQEWIKVIKDYATVQETTKNVVIAANAEQQISEIELMGTREQAELQAQSSAIAQKALAADTSAIDKAVKSQQISSISAIVAGNTALDASRIKGVATHSTTAASHMALDKKESASNVAAALSGNAKEAFKFPWPVAIGMLSAGAAAIFALTQTGGGGGGAAATPKPPQLTQDFGRGDIAMIQDREFQTRQQPEFVESAEVKLRIEGTDLVGAMNQNQLINSLI